MQQPASLSVSAAPAPVIKHAATVQLTYEEVRAAALSSVLDDFARQQQYRQLRTRLRTTGGDVQIISHSSGATLSKESATRLLKEHTSAAWSVFFYQWSLFGLTGISSVATAMGFYLAVYHNRMFLPFGPMGAAVTWRLWNLLETAWEQQRYIDNAAQLRDMRQGNPMNFVARRTTRGGGSATADEPSTELI